MVRAEHFFLLLFQIITNFQSAAVKRLVPLFDRVLVKKFEAVTQTKGGIMIPEKAQGKVLQGTVVAVGPGARLQVSSEQIFFHSIIVHHFLICELENKFTCNVHKLFSYHN